MSPFLALLDCFRRGPAARPGHRRPAVECLEDRTLLAALQLLPSSQISISRSVGANSQSGTGTWLPSGDGTGPEVLAYIAGDPTRGSGRIFQYFNDGIVELDGTLGGDPAGGSFSGTATARFQIIPTSTVELPGDEVVLSGSPGVSLSVLQLAITHRTTTGEAYSGTLYSTYSASYTLYGQSHGLFSGSNSLTDPASSSGPSDGTTWNGNPSAPPILARIGDEIDISVQFSLSASFDPSLSLPPSPGNFSYLGPCYGPGNDICVLGGNVHGSVSLRLTPTPAPYQLVVYTQPPHQVNAGGKFDVQIAAESAGIVDTGFTGPVTIALANNPGGGTLGGTLIVNAVDGVASFPDLTLDRTGTGYTLQATTAGQLPVTTNALTVADQLEVTKEPPSQVVAGHPFDVQITAEDANGNPDANFTGTVMIALANPGSSTLGGTLSVPATGGVADFPNLTVDKAGTGYVLQASGPAGLAVPATTNPFNVADRLAVTAQPPSPVAAGNRFDVQVSAAEDVQGNLDTNFTGPVTILLDNGPAGSTLDGTLTVDAVAGVADFRDLILDKAGTGYTLLASDGLSSATTNPFDVMAASVLPTSVQWNTPSQGGVHFSYQVINGPLSQNVPLAFYWADGPEFPTDDLAPVNYPFTVRKGTSTQSYGPVSIPGPQLTGSPAGTSYLLAVADPDNTLGNFDPQKNVFAMPLVLPVSRLYQSRDPSTNELETWAGDPLGFSTKDSIGNSGCALTSLAMALNYAGVATDPHILNGQLTNPPVPLRRGYVDADHLDWGQATYIAAFSAGNPSVQWHGVITSDDQQLRDLITSHAAPVAVQVFNPSSTNMHFVLVTGLDRYTFTINDPGPYADRTTLDAYPTYQTRGYVTDPATDLAQLYVASSSTNANLNLSVTNAAGQATGVPPGATSPLHQIPNAVYFVDGPVEDLSGQNPGDATAQFVYIAQPGAGTYGVELSGAGTAIVTTSGVSSAGQPTAATVVTGSSSSGTPFQFSVSYDPQPGATPGNARPGGGTSPAPLPQIAGDVTSMVRVSRGKGMHHGSRYRQSITVVNDSGRNLAGPIKLVLDGLSRKVKVRHPTGAGAASPDLVLVPPGGTFLAGQTLTLTLTLIVPAGQRPRFTARVLAGA
jgi:hypothetical protein